MSALPAAALAFLLAAGLPAPDAAALRAKLEAITKGRGASFGIVFKDLESGARIAINERKVFHAASTMKTPILLELLRRADANELSLEAEVEVKNDFRSLVDGSPFAIELEKVEDGKVAPLLGKRASLRFLATEMIVRSSNLAANILLSKLRPAAVQRFTDALGASTVHVRRCVEDGKAFEKGLNNETDAAGMAALMEAVVATKRLSPKAKGLAWDILSAQMWNEEIPAGLPPDSGASIAHKSGWIGGVRHDAAVVRLADGRRYVLVILADGFPEGPEADQRVIGIGREVSRAVWDAMNSIARR